MSQTVSREIAGLRLTRRDLCALDGRPVFTIWAPDDPDALLDELDDEEFQRTDERMPYFGHVWPAAEALVAHLLQGPPRSGSVRLAVQRSLPDEYASMRH